MRDQIALLINGQAHAVGGADVFLSLAEFLRNQLGLVGTKVVCSEGDCGACSVLVGRADGDRVKYQVVDACIQFVFQLDGCHVVTIEAVADDEQLSCVQQSMVDCHASQCGFCTPGVVMGLTALAEEAGDETHDALSPDVVRDGLTGNLCRCTGYAQILRASQQLGPAAVGAISKRFPAVTAAVLEREATADLLVRDANGQSARSFCGPASLPVALEFLADHPQAKVVAGATDVGVQINKRVISPEVILDLNRIPELRGADVTGGEIVAGACTTWTELLQLTEQHQAEFHKILRVFGAPQIRNVGTIGGNLANASPIADALPFLFVCDATVEICSRAATRSININDFYTGYKQIDLRPGELIRQVRIPLPGPDELLRLFKVSRRRDLDIASFTAAIRLTLDGDTIAAAAIAFGAVGPTVLRAPDTETFLVGRPFLAETFAAAGDVAVGEIQPQSDVRGHEGFRRQLTRNVLLKVFHEHVQGVGSGGPA